MTTDLHAQHAATDCPNCSAAVSGNFCHGCGQETVLHPPSTREFMHEFIGHYVALEGKLWKSLWLLLFRPGRLTLEYIKGRRVRYVQPLRLYLTFSLIFFAVMKFDGHELIHFGNGQPTPAQVAARDDDKVDLVHEDSAEELSKGKSWVESDIAPRSRYLADHIEHVMALSHAEREHLLTTAFYSYAPYAIFFMMPLFALYLKVLYLGSGRRYGEHLLFALHVNGFAFLAMTLWMLAPPVFGHGYLKFASWLWLVLYLPKAMRRVYGGSRWATVVRWLVLMLLHLVTLGLAIGLAMIAFGLLH